MEGSELGLKCQKMGKLGNRKCIPNRREEHEQRQKGMGLQGSTRSLVMWSPEYELRVEGGMRLQRPAGAQQEGHAHTLRIQLILCLPSRYLQLPTFHQRSRF